MDCIPWMNKHRWRYSLGTSGIGRPSPSWAFQRSKQRKWISNGPFFTILTTLTILVLFIQNNQVQWARRNYPVWILAEFPEVRVRTPSFKLLNSWESIQGSNHTTSQLRNNLERPAAKCSSGHSLRTCWCEIPLEIPIDRTDLFPRFMKNWSNSLWLRCGWVGTRLILRIVRLHLFENNLTDTFGMFLSILRMATL